MLKHKIIFFILMYFNTLNFAWANDTDTIPPETISKPTDLTIEDADRLLLANRFLPAENAYRALLKNDDTGDCYAGLAVALAKQGIPSKIIEAEKLLYKAKNKFADNPNIISAGGYVAYIHSKNVASPAKRDLYLQASENLCKRAIKDNPDILIAQQTLGLDKLASDEANEAIEPLTKAVQLSDNEVNLTLLAQALLTVNPNDPQAETLLNQALKQNKNYALAHTLHAQILASQGKSEDAFMELHEVPEKSRSSSWYQVEGDIYKTQGDGPAALTSWQEAIKTDPHNSDAYKHQAKFYATRGDGELAMSQMHNALEILPNDMNLRKDLAELALRQDKLDVAEQEYKTILATDPDNANALLGMSRVYYRKARRDGQYPPGWQDLMNKLESVVTEKNVSAQIIKSGANNLKESIKLSEAEKALTQNKFNESRKLFSDVIDSHKQDPYELLTLADQAFNDGDLRSAQRAFNYALKIPEITSQAEQGINKIKLQKQEAKRQTDLGDATTSLPMVAIDHYKQALIADPQYPRAYYGLYLVYARAKKPPKTQDAINYAICFLETADNDDPLKDEVASNLKKLNKQIGKKN